MGSFKIEILAIGDHGRDRTKKDGEKVDFNIEGANTPDAVAFQLVEALKKTGAMVEEARIIHWPGQETEVTDDLLTCERTGNF